MDLFSRKRARRTADDDAAGASSTPQNAFAAEVVARRGDACSNEACTNSGIIGTTHVHSSLKPRTWSLLAQRYAAVALAMIDQSDATVMSVSVGKRAPNGDVPVEVVLKGDEPLSLSVCTAVVHATDASDPDIAFRDVIIESVIEDGLCIRFLATNEA